MHFSIPDTKEVKEGNGSSYVLFSIYINGIFHCGTRFSELHALNDKLKQEFGSNNLPSFPPKKLFPLSKIQLDERQFLLEKYLQSLSQYSEFINSNTLRKFLFSCQRKSVSKWHIENDLTVWMLNNTKVSVKVSFDDNSEIVLQRVCDNLRIPHELTQYFSLFVQKQLENEKTSLIHYLQDYECPIITLHNIPEPKKIILRKNYWDLSLDLKLMSNRSTLNVLYSQTSFDVNKERIICNNETKEKLMVLQCRGAKREYLEIARTLKFYGYVRFENCLCDYPQFKTETIVSLSHNDIIFTSNIGVDEKEILFRITRIKCWKVTQHNDCNKTAQLSFEYLISSNKLQWITITSENVFILSVCLQSVVNELLLRKSQTLIPDGSLVSDYLNGKITNRGNSHGTSSLELTVKKSKFKKQEATPRNKANFSFYHFGALLENDSFENIGDDDL